MTTPSHPVADTPAAGRTAAAARRAEDRVAEALDARDVLAAALTAAGVQLPAMDVRTPWQDDGSESEAESEGGTGVRPPRYALVHLGVCSAPVALELAAVVRKGVGR